MKIVIVGPGAMGCLFGGFLARAGEEVVLLDHRPERARQLSQNGLRIETPEGGFKVAINATADAEEIGAADVIFLCVKAFHTRAAFKRTAPCLGNKTLVLTLQNGLANVTRLAEGLVNFERIIGGTTGHGAILLETGHVMHTGTGDTVIGSMDYAAASSNLQTIKALLDKAGIATTITANLTSALWGKLVLNCAINPLAALTRLKNGELLREPALTDLLERVAEEAAAIAIANGLELPYPSAAARAKEVCSKTAENINSMLADVLRGSPTEIDEINGAVIGAATALGLRAPLNEALVALVKGLQYSYLGRG
jgi:2-dehydropantoate 2-reductase